MKKNRIISGSLANMRKALSKKRESAQEPPKSINPYSSSPGVHIDTGGKSFRDVVRRYFGSVGEKSLTWNRLTFKDTLRKAIREAGVERATIREADEPPTEERLLLPYRDYAIEVTVPARTSRSSGDLPSSKIIATFTFEHTGEMSTTDEFALKSYHIDPEYEAPSVEPLPAPSLHETIRETLIPSKVWTLDELRAGFSHAVNKAALIDCKLDEEEDRDIFTRTTTHLFRISIPLKEPKRTLIDKRSIAMVEARVYPFEVLEKDGVPVFEVIAFRVEEDFGGEAHPTVLDRPEVYPAGDVRIKSRVESDEELAKRVETIRTVLGTVKDHVLGAPPSHHVMCRTALLGSPDEHEDVIPEGALAEAMESFKKEAKEQFERAIKAKFEKVGSHIKAE